MSQRQFLPLDEDSCEPTEQAFDLASMTPQSYLRQVRFERKKCPQVVRVAPLLINEDHQPQEKDPVSSTTISGMSKEWQEIQREKFAAIHQQIVAMRDNKKTANPLPENFDTSIESNCIAFCIENEPKLSIMLALEQNHLEELLSHLSSHLTFSLESPEFCKNTWITKWIYATSACLRTPLDPDVHNCLRMIAKSCMDCVKLLDADPADSLLPWYLIIAVIALHFKQFDLLSL